MKHAVYSGTRNLYADMETAAKSLVANSDVDVIHFLIEDAGFPHELPGIVRCHDVSGQGYFPPDGANTGSQYTYMTLMRAALCHVLPDVDKVLSLDCDTIAVGYCSDVWDTDVEGCYFAASLERWLKRPGTQYCNTGVSLFNLEELRDGKADEVIGVLNRRSFRWPEQDVMNFLCQGRIAEIDSAYNYCPWTVAPQKAVRIVHYAARDDWRDEPPARKYREMSWDEALRRHRGCCS